MNRSLRIEDGNLIPSNIQDFTNSPRNVKDPQGILHNITNLTSDQSNGELNPLTNGVSLTSLTGPSCQIDEIDDYSATSVGLLKDAVKHCLNMADWVERQHIQLFFNAKPLQDDGANLDDYQVVAGSTINYIIMIP